MNWQGGSEKFWIHRRPIKRGLGKIKDSYLQLTLEERPYFFLKLLERIETRPEKVDSLIQGLTEARGDDNKWRQALVSLRTGIGSPRLKVFRRFIGIPGGLKFLLDLRADILTAQRYSPFFLEPLDHDLVLLFESWFQDGFLFLEEISLDSPYRQIELIKNGDMVHPMTRLEEMVRRLGKDRRCFAMYHRAMPEEPIIFIEVALTRGIVRSIHEIIDEPDDQNEEDKKRDTVVFYSINNTQNGLAGLGLGQMLIFQVVDLLRQEHPDIKNFCTLSPMPGFWKRFLKPLLEGKADHFTTNTERLEKIFDRKARESIEDYLARRNIEAETLSEMLLQVFSDPEWKVDGDLVQNLAKPIKTLGYAYLAEEKDRAGRPLDSVANFHLGNGATISPNNVNYGANWSNKGVERSLSLMVNYIYSYGWRKQFGGTVSWLGNLMPAFTRR